MIIFSQFKNNVFIPTDMDYIYIIVVFQDVTKNDSKKLIDTIPTSWLAYEKSEPNQFFCKFMPPPYRE